MKFLRKRPSRAEGWIPIARNPHWKVGALVQTSDVLMRIRRIEPCGEDYTLLVTEVGAWERRFLRLRAWLGNVWRWFSGR